MKRIFDIEKIIDEQDGSITYRTRRDEDFDKDGIPLPFTPSGSGESELDALWDLIEKLYIAEKLGE
jgi:hypothetical protein